MSNLGSFVRQVYDICASNVRQIEIFRKKEIREPLYLLGFPNF